MTSQVTQICSELARRDPAKARQIESLARRDDRFRTICDDYGEAIRAARRWAAEPQGGADKADEFKRLAEDLCSEARAYLDRAAKD